MQLTYTSIKHTNSSKFSRCDDPFLTWSDIDLEDFDEVFHDEDTTMEDDLDDEISKFSTIF